MSIDVSSSSSTTISPALTLFFDEESQRPRHQSNVVVPLVGQYGLWVSFFSPMATSPHPNAFGFYYPIKIFKNISEEANTILMSYGILDIYLKKNRIEIVHLELHLSLMTEEVLDRESAP